MTQYESWKLATGGRVNVRLVREQATPEGVRLTGIKVRRDGDDAVGPGGATVVIVGLGDDVTDRKPLAVSLFYGWLVPLGHERDGIDE